jgi:capsular polysaccharide biosynthesis protein
MNQGVDSKALVATLITKIPILLIIAVTGAIVGSGLNLIIASYERSNAKYVSETKYYIEFAPGVLDAADYYNDYTWNDVIGTDLILGRVMDIVGEDYDREHIKSMIEADIVSDVRYLKITISADTPESVKSVENAFEQSISEFGDTMNEFSSIYKIMETDITREEIPNFTLRAALLGVCVFGIAALLVIIFRFCLGSSFYTRRDVTRALGISVYGISYKNGKYEGAKPMPTEKYNDMFYCDSEDKNKLIAIIPFGKPYREKLADVIYDMRLQGSEVTGAVIVGASDIWYKLYRA